MKNTDYAALTAALTALTRDVPHKIANLSNAAALLWQELPDINWVGFYLMEGETLVLGPFQGKPACIEIPLTRGVCGKAARENATVRVADVHRFPGHIACDSASRSEMVVPLRLDGQVVGVLDVDSPYTDRFSLADEQGLEIVARVVEGFLK